MKAKDIMEQVHEFLSPEVTLREAVNKMRVCKAGDNRIGVKGMLVLDADQELLGILSVKDILKTIIPSYLSPSLSEFSWDGMLEDLAKKYADRKVGDIMEKKVIAVSQEAPLMECADFVVQHNVQRLPVVDDKKKVVGIIYIRDIYHALVKSLFDDGREECRS